MRKGNCCDMRGMLSFLILFLISKKRMSGKDITNELESRRGEKPSPGTIYPALKSLREAGLIVEEKEGKEVYYTLSNDGKNELKEAKKYFCKTFSDIF
jgi:PadR family transcriptional regulator, regulatory protein PadR